MRRWVRRQQVLHKLGMKEGSVVPSQIYKMSMAVTCIGQACHVAAV